MTMKIYPHFVGFSHTLQNDVSGWGIDRLNNVFMQWFAATQPDI
jgi:hypothetical protein